MWNGCCWQPHDLILGIAWWNGHRNGKERKDLVMPKRDVQDVHKPNGTALFTVGFLQMQFFLQRRSMVGRFWNNDQAIWQGHYHDEFMFIKNFARHFHFQEFWKRRYLWWGVSMLALDGAFFPSVGKTDLNSAAITSKNLWNGTIQALIYTSWQGRL